MLRSSSRASERLAWRAWGRCGLIQGIVAYALVSCTVVGPVDPPQGAGMSDKIRLDLSRLNDEGLIGPPNGLRSLAYEFCIPARSDLADEVRAIDQTAQVYPNSRGRIGCTGGEYLCIGHTQQAAYRTVLARLAGLDYVTRIEPSYGE